MDGDPASDTASVHTVESERTPGLCNAMSAKELPDDVLKILQCLDAKLRKKFERLIRVKAGGRLS